jgi:hypothetical protein
MSTQMTTSQYLVLCRSTSWHKDLSSEELQKVLTQFTAWFERLTNEGKIKKGHPIAPEGKSIAGRKAISDGPFAESKEAIAGYWFIQANSLEEAVEIAQSDPCLDYGVTVEVRPVIQEPDWFARARQNQQL